MNIIRVAKRGEEKNFLDSTFKKITICVLARNHDSKSSIDKKS